MKKCSKGHMRKPGEEVCYQCIGKMIDEAEPVKSPRDKMIRSKDLITKRDGRVKGTKTNIGG
jgi:hypothetical protein